jgi:hypothetical protein
MGYFSNGAEGMDYEARYCRRCVHGPGHAAPEKPGCAVWLAHLLHNYGQDGSTREILSLLIPPSQDGLGNERCEMFKEAPDGQAVALD